MPCVYQWSFSKS